MPLLNLKSLSIGILAGTLALQGCGWHLRGSQALPPQLQTLHLQTASQTSEFTRSLKRSLEAADVSLVESSAAAPYTLKISPVSNTKRTLSTTGSAKVAEYELTSSITYAIQNREGEQLVAPTQLNRVKTYLYNSNNAISSFEEENLLREEMQRDLIQQLMRRYRALSNSAPTVVEEE